MSLGTKILRGFARLQGGAPCPKCRQKIPVSPDQEVLLCSNCGYRFSVSEAAWTQTTPVQHWADPDLRPSGTKIVRQELGPGLLGWEVPPTGRAGGLLFFSYLWLGFMVVFTFIAGGAAFSDKGSGGWIMVLFSVPFWAVGIGMLYAGLRTKYARHFLAVGPDEVKMSRILFGRTTRKSLSRAGIDSVEVKEFYQRNYQPVHGIEIHGKEGKLRFGTSLTDEEKQWLAADLHRAIFPPETSPAGAEKTLPPARLSTDFAVEFPPAQGTGTMLGQILGTIIVVGFLAIGIFLIKDDAHFRWIWLTINSVFLCLIAFGWFSAIRNRHYTVRVTGDAHEVRVVATRDGRVIREETISRQPSLEPRLTRINQSNASATGEPVRIELLGPDRAIPIVNMYPGAAARAPFAQLVEALG